MTSEIVLGEISTEVNNASALVPSSVKIYPTLTNGTSIDSGTYYYKIGTRVFVNIAVTVPTNQGSLALFTLPAGYRPSSYVAYTGYTGTHSTNSETPKGLVTSNGLVTNDPSASGTTYACITFDAFN